MKKQIFFPIHHTTLVIRHILILILLTLVLSACGSDVRPTRPAQLDIVVPTFPPLIDTLPPALMESTSRPNNGSNQPLPTAAPNPNGNNDLYLATPIPNFDIFVTPPPLATFEAQRNQSSRNVTLKDVKVESLQKVNGVPVIPYYNFQQSKHPPLPPRQNNYGPNGRPRVALQIGHYKSNEMPEEIAHLRGQTGGSGGGRTEVEVSFDIARRAAVMLQSRGVHVDILPATVPPSYTADVFVAIHCDAVTDPNPHGFKLARSEESPIPKTDDALMNFIYEQYEQATGMRRDNRITPGMTGYYSFYDPYRQYTISKITPAVILETGFITSPIDQKILFNRPDDVARGLANGIIVFLNRRPPLNERENPISLAPAIEAAQTITGVYDAPNGGNLMAYVNKQQVFLSFSTSGDSYRVWLPVLERTGYLRKTDTILVNIPR
jgi:N-acetylmuramoyl-L-alanine amidase